MSAKQRTFYYPIVIMTAMLVAQIAAQSHGQVLKPIDTDQIETPSAGSEASAAKGEQTPAAEAANAIYAMTKGAKTGKDYSRIVESCELTLKRDDLTDGNRTDINSIYSWALNRRGKKRLETAEAFEMAENIDQSDIVFESAMSDFENAIEVAPKRWQTYLSRGIAFVSKEKYEEAAKDFTFVVETNPKKSSGWFNRAEVYYSLGKFKQAIKDYDRCLKISAFDVQAVTGRAHAKFELSQYKDSLADYDEAVRLAPRDPMALANRGDVHQSLGEWAKAYEDYVACVKIKPLAIGYQKAAWMLATCPSEDYFRPTAAIDMANKAIRMEGESYQRLETLAVAQAAMGDFDSAKANQLKAVEAAEEISKLVVEDAQARLELFEAGKAVTQKAD